MKVNKKYHTVETASRSNRKIVEKGRIDNPNTQIRHHSLFWLGTHFNKKGRAKPHF
jgi:hypothetical protein